MICPIKHNSHVVSRMLPNKINPKILMPTLGALHRALYTPYTIHYLDALNDWGNDLLKRQLLKNPTDWSLPARPAVVLFPILPRLLGYWSKFIVRTQLLNISLFSFRAHKKFLRVKITLGLSALGLFNPELASDFASVLSVPPCSSSLDMSDTLRT